MPVSRLGAQNCFLGAVGHWFLTGSQSHRPASPPSESWQEPLLPLTGLSHVLQQNSAADLSMLVLESLEKAEVEVADELLGEAAQAPPCTHAHACTHICTHAFTCSYTEACMDPAGVVVDTRSPCPACPRRSRAPLGRRLVKAGGERSGGPRAPPRCLPPEVAGFASFRCPVQGRSRARASGSGLCAFALQKVWPGCSA